MVQLDGIADEAAVAGSFYGALPAPVRSRLIEGATLLEVPASRLIFRPTDPHRRVGLLARGLARVFLTGPDGRQISTRYARVGSVISNISGPGATWLSLNVAAVTDSTVLELVPETLKALGVSDSRVAWALAEDLTRRLDDLYATLAANCFGSMTERVGRLLLDRAERDPVDQCLVVKMTQQELADDVGKVREMVARTLRELRVAGLIETRTGEVIILDADGLATLVGRWHR